MSFNTNQTPPEIEQILRFINKFKSSIAGFIIPIVIAIAVFSSYYTVEPDEEAIVIRLGQFIDTTTPGLHFKIPFGIDEVILVKTKIVHQEEFGFRSLNTSAKRTTYSTRNFDTEALMLTGDLNVAEVSWVVQYQISNPFKFKFKTSQPEQNIRDVSESILRRVVGDKLVTEVLTTGRVEIANSSRVLMQEILDRYDMGVSIKSVKLQDVNPPKVVQASFNDVNAAKQEQEKMINQAEENYNRVIPEARGKAKKQINEAEGYAAALVNTAHGDAARFKQLYAEYRKAPAITKKRIYLETMEEIFSRITDITIVDSKVKGLLPVFNNGGSNAK